VETHTIKPHHDTRLRCNGDSGSDPLTEVKVEIESSLGIETKFKGAVDSLRISLLKLLYRPEWDRGVSSSGVAPP
jgi:uncharacterized membrane protein